MGYAAKTHGRHYMAIDYKDLLERVVSTFVQATVGILPPPTPATLWQPKAPFAPRRFGRGSLRLLLRSCSSTTTCRMTQLLWVVTKGLRDHCRRAGSYPVNWVYPETLFSLLMRN